MKQLLLFCLVCILFIFSCQNRAAQEMQYEEQEGIFVEIIDSLPSETYNPYNVDNTIYIPGKEYIFDYQFFTKDGQERKLSREGFALTPVDKLTTATLIKLSISAQVGCVFASQYPDYNQTELLYRYYLINDSLSWPTESSGVVENEKNIWMHPWRRAKFFYYLQINPYPFIKQPFEIGHTWDWNLLIGGQWGYPDWATWEGNMNFYHQYEITDKQELQTTFAGAVDCYVVTATATSELGKSKLTSYFNEKYGFVKFDYLNIDSSQFIINLIEIKGD